MGIDFRGADAHWSYSGFHRFRARLAAAIGLELERMVGFGGDRPWTTKDPILPLLNHSDCSGTLMPEECATIAPRLREMVAEWPEDDYDKDNALQLAAGMEECVRMKRALQFC